MRTLKCKKKNLNKILPIKTWKITPKSSILKQKFGRFRNFPFTAQQPKWQKSCSKMWPIEQLYIELGFSRNVIPISQFLNMMNYYVIWFFLTNQNWENEFPIGPKKSFDQTLSYSKIDWIKEISMYVFNYKYCNFVNSCYVSNSTLVRYQYRRTLM